MRTLYLYLGVDSAEEAERVYSRLMKDGEVYMPPGNVFCLALQSAARSVRDALDINPSMTLVLSSYSVPSLGTYSPIHTVDVGAPVLWSIPANPLLGRYSIPTGLKECIALYASVDEGRLDSS
jgi:hypothetical protein